VQPLTHRIDRHTLGPDNRASGGHKMAVHFTPAPAKGMTLCSQFTTAFVQSILCQPTRARDEFQHIHRPGVTRQPAEQRFVVSIIPHTNFLLGGQMH